MRRINRRKFIISSFAAGAVMATGSLRKVNLSAAESSRMAILKDKTKCVNCKVCVNACLRLFDLPSEYSYLEVVPFKENGIRHRKRISCMHCEDAPCVKACPTGTLFKGDTGFTYIKKERCIGCEYCRGVCPYNIIKIKNNKVSKCTGCQDLVEKGDVPRCVSVCPVNALNYGTRGEMLETAKNRVAEIINIYPMVTVYGEKEFGGLGLICILGNTPSVYGYPPNPSGNTMAGWWKDIVNPGGILVMGAAAAGVLMIYGISRRNVLKEKKEDEGGKSDE